MARNPALEQLIDDRLAGMEGISRKPMFGGLAWLMNGHLLMAARDIGLMARLGKGHDGWALALEGIEPMVMQGRAMAGWVRASSDAARDKALRERLVAAAVQFVASLPAK